MLSELHRPQKVFTLEEATRTLPLVGRILKDIVEANEEIENLQNSPATRGDSEIGDDANENGTSRSLDERIGFKAIKIKEYLRELDAIGCECKDTRVGLVDFPALLSGRVVLLCWKLGEPEIAHWHEVDAGFGGRQSVSGVFS